MHLEAVKSQSYDIQLAIMQKYTQEMRCFQINYGIQYLSSLMVIFKPLQQAGGTAKMIEVKLYFWRLL